ncbi:hypothetical protein ANN_01936 [Periplaneta americana]|uniref:Uncharacterized protein n=1 Tax=Periplaneta americana TaxID=6978 RepID=A0ABQ8TUY8_PERAM|nr:hypothetical protein ANN_01936 [Periplaneta americana]
MILMVLIYVIAKKHFDSVDLKFMVSEHSYMPSNREFGIIEKRKKKMQDHGSRREHRIFKKGQSLTSITNLQCLQRLERRPVVPDAEKRDLLSMLDFLDEKYHALYRKICA